MSLVRASIVTAMAACGLLAAHWLDYVLVVPDAGHRHDLLFRTGHGYLPRVTALCAAAGLVAALASTAIGLTGRARERRLSTDVLLLACVQTGAFVALESLERLLSEVAADGAFLSVIAVGSVLQVFTACASMVLMRLLERVGAAIRDALTSPASPAHTPRTINGCERDTFRRLALRPDRAPRAPPVVLAA